ncbi:unnamed protein product [Toxocara canis]|uniref:Uncharacterized protein n=1 Tax=Toxocara canis TaxID=6265 RepID=A0A3P7H522_TOXCA|nr:unnamed protein product [Toxocara canis]
MEEHNRLMSGMGSGGDRLLYIIKRPWFIAVAGVLMWMVFVALIALIWWRWKRSKGKAAARLGMPFIKINDGSVHLTARDALWMDHTNFNSAQRTLLLNNSLNAAACNGPPLYTQTPHQTDFYIDAHPHNEYASNLMSTMERSQSPHHYQYAALASAPASAMSTFYGGQQVMDDPSPYATTTLVMNNRQKWLKEHMLRGPVLPSNPVPSGPPPRFQDVANSQTLNGRRSANSARCAPFAETKIHASHHSESPPHTDVSYVQSSDGTGGSSNGRSKAGTLNGGRRSPPKQTLLDFMPPPPPGAPPPEDVPNTYLNGSVEPIANRMLDVNDHYDAVSDSLLRRDSRYATRSQPAEMNRPDSRCKNDIIYNTKAGAGYRRGGSGAIGVQDEEDSQRSSLMLDEKTRSAFCSSSEADEENTDEEERTRNATQTPEYATHRPSQPCMGVSASTLSQSSCTFLNRLNTSVKHEQ